MLDCQSRFFQFDVLTGAEQIIIGKKMTFLYAILPHQNKLITVE